MGEKKQKAMQVTSMWQTLVDSSVSMRHSHRVSGGLPLALRARICGPRYDFNIF